MHAARRALRGPGAVPLWRRVRPGLGARLWLQAAVVEIQYVAPSTVRRPVLTVHVAVTPSGKEMSTSHHAREGSPAFGEGDEHVPPCLAGPVLVAPPPYIRDHAGLIHLHPCRQLPRDRCLDAARCSLAFNSELPRNF